MNAHPKDPAARGRIASALIGIAILWLLCLEAGVRPGVLFEPHSLAVLGQFLSGFLPPATGASFLGLLLGATLETLAIATAGTAIAVLVAAPLALANTRALSVSAIGPNARRWPGRAARAALRVLLTIMRGIPELVWALLFVRVFGLGPAAGVLALGLTYGGMLAKVYSEILESGETRAARSLLEAGSGRSAALLYGLLPGASQELVSYTVYRWECAVRASAVMGFVGAGGLGQLMDQAMKMLNGGEAFSILLVFLVLVLGADALSSFLRRRVAGASLLRARVGVNGFAALLCAVLAGAVLASFAFLDIRFGALFSRESMGLVGEFVASFFPPYLSSAWVGKVVGAAWETFAISAAGTVLAAAAGLLVALPASRRYGAGAARAARFLLNALRSVPELVWATIAVLAVGLGPFSGTLALAIHTTGVLGRLFGEALENAPPQPALALSESGAGSAAAFLYGTLPQIIPQLAAYTLYRWEMNIRMAAILGFVGAGGLGQLLYVELSLFHHAEAATVIAAMLALSIVVDAASARMRPA